VARNLSSQPKYYAFVRSNDALCPDHFSILKAIADNILELHNEANLFYLPNLGSKQTTLTGLYSNPKQVE
jgi:hypothetical protein